MGRGQLAQNPSAHQVLKHKSVAKLQTGLEHPKDLMPVDNQQCPPAEEAATQMLTREGGP